ncbi:MAG: hypothetical protein ACKOOG_06950, partial [Actinomycetota bacterium]
LDQRAVVLGRTDAPTARDDDGRLLELRALLLLDGGQVGWSGARQQITNVEQAPAREAGEKFEDDGTGAEKVVAFLEQLKVV